MNNDSTGLMSPNVNEDYYVFASTCKRLTTVRRQPPRAERMRMCTVPATMLWPARRGRARGATRECICLIDNPMDAIGTTQATQKIDTQSGDQTGLTIITSNRRSSLLKQLFTSMANQFLQATSIHFVLI